MSSATVQPAKISRVLPDSIAEEIGFEAGDAIRIDQSDSTKRFDRLSFSL